MTDKHPTDALPINVPREMVDRHKEFCAAVRAERIAAYNLGRESMREEAAKKYPSIARQIRSIEL